MSVKKVLYLSIVVLIISIVTTDVSSRDFTGPEYIEPPRQVNLAEIETLTIEGDEGPVELQLLATYRISAAVKSIEDYTTDFTSQISPRDFALAWADINKPRIDRYVSYSQKERWYYFTLKGGSGVDIDYVDLNTANTHIIPANDEVAALVKDVTLEDYITMEGYLVNAIFTNGSWSSSLIREDTGDGSCEILYVTDITIHNNY